MWNTVWDGVEGQLGNVEVQMAELTRRTGNVETQVANLTERMANVEGRVTELSSSLQDMRTSMRHLTVADFKPCVA